MDTIKNNLKIIEMFYYVVILEQVYGHNDLKAFFTLKTPYKSLFYAS